MEKEKPAGAGFCMQIEKAQLVIHRQNESNKEPRPQMRTGAQCCLMRCTKRFYLGTAMKAAVPVVPPIPTILPAVLRP